MRPSYHVLGQDDRTAWWRPGEPCWMMGENGNWEPASIYACGGADVFILHSQSGDRIRRREHEIRQRDAVGSASCPPDKTTVTERRA